MKNTTNFKDLQEKGEVNVIRFGVCSTREVQRPLKVIYCGETSSNLPSDMVKYCDGDIDRLAVKILGDSANESHCYYYVVLARYTFNGGPCIDFDAQPTHALFITNINKLRAYGGINGCDVINVSEDCHMVAIPRRHAMYDAMNTVFA